MVGMQLFNRRILRREYELFSSRIHTRLRPTPLTSFRDTCQFQLTSRRTIIHVHPVLLPPLVFSGLVLALWTWKCFMMVLFQNKIIYMPGLPLNARREKISDYINQCGGITWREEKIVTADRTQIALAIASVESPPNTLDSKDLASIYIVYFQGNASSLPPRLPFLSPVLQLLQNNTRNFQNVSDRSPHGLGKVNTSVRYTMVCVSYRGYWTSKGRPSERGIAKDAAAALEWITSQHKADSGHRIPTIFWGQSIGAGVATSLAAHHTVFSGRLALQMLILETPFTSIRDMLVTIYPQRWLPYRYLWPFLRNHLDSWQALEQIAKQPSTELPEVVILEAGQDELVPKSHGDALEKRCTSLGLKVQRHVIKGALHTEVLSRAEGRAVAAVAVGTVSRSINNR